MRTRDRVALVLTLVACVPGWSHAQERTEQEIVELIVRDGPRARAIRAAADVVIAEQAARIVFPNPAASYSREGAGFTEFVQMEQPFPAFGLRKALERAGVAARQAAEAERDARLWQLRSEGLDALARLRASSERVQSAPVVVAHRGTHRVLNTREKEGEGSRFDRVRAQQELVDARQAMVARPSIERRPAACWGVAPRGVVVPDTVAQLSPPQQPTLSTCVAAPSRAAPSSGRCSLRPSGSLEADAARRSTDSRQP